MVWKRKKEGRREERKQAKKKCAAERDHLWLKNPKVFIIFLLQMESVISVVRGKYTQLLESHSGIPLFCHVVHGHVKNLYFKF